MINKHYNNNGINLCGRGAKTQNKNEVTCKWRIKILGVKK